MGLEKLFLDFKRNFKKVITLLSLTAFLSCSFPTPPNPKITSTLIPETKTELKYDYTTTVTTLASEYIDASVGGNIGVNNLESILDGTNLTIPEGALESNTTISIGEVNNPPTLPPGLNYVGSPVNLGPDGINFQSPSIIQIPYNEASLSDAGISDDSDLKLYSYDQSSNKWMEVKDISVDTDNNIVTAELNHFSYYAITGWFDTPEDLGIPQQGDLLYSLGAVWDEGNPLLRNAWMPGHVGIYVGEKQYSSGLASDDVKEFGRYNVIEARSQGVQYSYYDTPNVKETFEDSLESFSGGNVFMGAREPKNFTLTQKQREDIVTYVEAQIGKPYALEQTIGSAFGMLPGQEVKGENEEQAYNCVGLAEKAYEVVGVNNGEGLVPEEQEEWIITPAEQYNATKPAESKGPAGGWIFYDKGYYSNGWRYLEAAPYDQPLSAWGTYGFIIQGADEIVIGTGKQNTLDIIAGDSAANKAADRCVNLIIINRGIIYDDWFLPSLRELDQIGLHLYEYGIGNFTGDSYWSSSEYQSTTGTTAWCTYFNAGMCTNHPKNINHHVRAIRTF